MLLWQGCHNDHELVITRQLLAFLDEQIVTPMTD
jgi:hypothetical protein